MSALPQPVIRSRTAHLLRELDVTLQIGQIASSFVEITDALDAIAEAALAVRGVHQISIDWHELPRFVRSVPIEHVACGSARAFVAANGREWGRLQLDFDPHNVAVESPVRFARFLGQQFALLLNRISVAEGVEIRKRQVSRLKSRIELRKTVPRARGVLARRLGITEQQAFELLLRKARQSGRQLSSIARSVIWSREIPDFLRPKLRELEPAEVTPVLNWQPRLAEVRI